jgi:hypothetical protein
MMVIMMKMGCFQINEARLSTIFTNSDDGKKESHKGANSQQMVGDIGSSEIGRRIVGSG